MITLIAFGKYVLGVGGVCVLIIFIVGGFFSWAVSPYPSKWTFGMFDGPPDYSRRNYGKRRANVQAST